MAWAISVLRTYFDPGEIDTATGRAIVAERFSALRRQIPIIYLLALINLFGLQIAVDGAFAIGFNPPTCLAACALVRIGQWFQAPANVSDEAMLRRLRQTFWVAAEVCSAISIWCLHLLQDGAASRLPVLLFGSMTAIGVSYGLSSFPPAARLPLLVLAFPLAGEAFLSDDTQFLGAGLGLSIVTLLILRLLNVHDRHFTALVRSRATIARSQERAEQARSEANQAATTDFLTGLPNRRAFVAAIEGEVARRDRPGRFTVAVIDLDRFKPINDTYGHATGDELLRIVAARLVEAAGEQAVVARLGGDEFAAMFTDVESAAAAGSAGERILAILNRPAKIHGRQFAVSASCGVALSRRGRRRLGPRILADADIALYRAKTEAPGTVALFERGMEAPRRRRARLERSLQLPDTPDNIELVFQPIVDLHSGRVIAQEALARWTDSELGQVSPAEFVPIAEQLNVIGGLSDRLLEKALAEAVHWPAPIGLSFNLSAVQLCSEGSVESMLGALERAGFPAQRLQVEVTETALLADLAKASDNLHRLRSNGVTVVLDDFGAGFASISYLREMQFDQIKLDGSLVKGAQDCPDRERLLGAVIGLCQALGVECVAEHIETEAQLKLLVRLGCGAGQGYWLHRPMSGEAARRLGEVGGVLADPQQNAMERSAA